MNAPPVPPSGNPSPTLAGRAGGRPAVATGTHAAARPGDARREWLAGLLAQGAMILAAVGWRLWTPHTPSVSTILVSILLVVTLLPALRPASSHGTPRRSDKAAAWSSGLAWAGWWGLSLLEAPVLPAMTAVALLAPFLLLAGLDVLRHPASWLARCLPSVLVVGGLLALSSVPPRLGPPAGDSLLAAALALLVGALVALAVHERARARVRADLLRAEGDRARRQLQALLDNRLVGTGLLHGGGHFLSNARGRELLSLEDGDQLRTLRERIQVRLHGRLERFEARCIARLRRRGALTATLRLPAAPGGRPRWLRVELRAVDPLDPAQGIVWLAEDIGMRREAEERLRQMADQDAMTGVAGRERLWRELRRRDAATRAGDAEAGGFALLWIDLDGFRRINEREGHVIGDAVLRVVAQRMQRVLRQADLVARVGGNAFAVLVDAAVQREEAVVTADKLLDAIGRPIMLGGRRLEVGASLGVVLNRGADRRPGALLAGAEAAMRAARAAGRMSWRPDAGTGFPRAPGALSPGGRSARPAGGSPPDGDPEAGSAGPGRGEPS